MQIAPKCLLGQLVGLSHAVCGLGDCAVSGGDLACDGADFNRVIGVGRSVEVHTVHRVRGSMLRRLMALP